MRLTFEISKLLQWTAILKVDTKFSPQLDPLIPFWEINIQQQSCLYICLADKYEKSIEYAVYLHI